MIVGLILCALIFSACSSTPEEEPEETTPTETTAEETEPQEEEPVEESEAVEAETAETESSSEVAAGPPDDVLAASQRAVEAKAKADSVKAQKSAAEPYDAAVALLAEGKDFEEAANYDEAKSAYTRAETSFLEAYDIAVEKRIEALSAMESADEAISNAEKRAEDAKREAGVTNEGGS